MVIESNHGLKWLSLYSAINHTKHLLQFFSDKPRTQLRKTIKNSFELYVKFYYRKTNFQITSLM